MRTWVSAPSSRTPCPAGAVVKSGAYVSRAILGENAVVEEGVKLGSVDTTKDTAVVGNDVVIGKGE